MKALVFHGKNDLRYEDVPVPEIGNGDVLVQVKACGICGTDVHIFEGAKGAAECVPPTILGHEMSGVVTRIGEDVKGLKMGDRVSIDPNRLCGACYYCRTGQGHFCENMVGYGTTRNGGFAEYITVAESQAHPFSSALSFLEAAMAEPLSCCLHGMDLSNVRQGSTAMIIGGGPIGLLMLQLARLSGATRIVLTEPVAAKRDAALTLGADLVIDPLREDVQAILKENSVNHIDTVIECAGLRSTIEDAIDYAGNCATVMMFGLTDPDTVIAVKPFEVFRKELKITASFINPYTFTRAIALLESGRIDVKSLIAREVALEDAFALFRSGETQKYGKVIVC